MEDKLDLSGLKKRPSGTATARKKVSRILPVAPRLKPFMQKSSQRLITLNYESFRNVAVGHAAFFLFKVAALEAIRRFSKARCPSAWRGLQALQIFCYPPFKWIQRWAPFKALVKGLQVMSRPLLVLSVATAFSDNLKCGDGASDATSDPRPEVISEVSSGQSSLDTGEFQEAQPLESENWLVQLYKELENQGVRLPERINEDELHQFYGASNLDFQCFLSSIKKTIRWRETYRILSRDELQMWSSMVFWHGSDVLHRPCLIVRLGMACSSLASNDRPRFVQAVISEVEFGVLHLVNTENPQITVLVDCEGLSPWRIPMQMMRYCSSILQDHFPNRLGCLFVIRLPAVVRVIAQTFIQILKPVTRTKLRIEGEMYQKILSEYLEMLPSYLGGECTCSKCSKVRMQDMHQPRPTVTSEIDREADMSESEDELSPLPSDETDDHFYVDCSRVIRTAAIGILIILVFVALVAGINDPESNFVLPYSSTHYQVHV